MGIEETHYGICFQLTRLSIWARKCYRLDFLMLCCTGHAGPTEKWLMNIPKEGETVLWGSCFMKESARDSAGHRRKWLTNCQHRWNSLWNFVTVLFESKWLGYLVPSNIPSSIHAKEREWLSTFILSEVWLPQDHVSLWENGLIYHWAELTKVTIAMQSHHRDGEIINMEATLLFVWVFVGHNIIMETTTCKGTI